MPLIDEEIIERVRRETPILNLVGSRVKLRKAGHMWKGLCPFHQEKTPSFVVHPDTGRFKCFGCGAGGDVIDFLVQADGVDFLTALKQLAAQLNISLDVQERPGLKRGRFKQVMPDVPEPDDKETWLYPDECCRWTHDAPQPLLDWLRQKGIALRTAKGLAHQDYLGYRRGQLVFFYQEGTKVRRDLNDSHSCYWAKGTASSPWCVQEIDHPDVQRVFVCEGESDTMRLMPFVGLHDRVIGLPGASWTPTPVMCWRIGAFRQVVLVFDGDKAGEAAEARIVPLLKKHAAGCTAFRLPMAPGKDVCTTSQHDLAALVKNPVKIF